MLGSTGLSGTLRQNKIAHGQEIVFQEITTGTGLSCHLPQLRPFELGDDDDLGFGEIIDNPVGSRHPIQTRHLQVHENPIGPLRAGGEDRLETVGTFDKLRIQISQAALQKLAHSMIIIGNENPHDETSIQNH
jgi:hypothetical protein